MIEQEPHELDPHPQEARVPPVRGEITKQPPVWPTVLGVIAIVWAGLGVLSAPFVVVLMILIPEQFGPPGVYILTTVVGLALSVLVLFAGIRLLQWRRSGVSLARTWSILNIVWGPIAMGMMLMAEFGAGDGKDPAELIGAIAGGACGGFFAIAPPIFVLIWFGRQAIKAQVAEWRP